MNVVGSRPDGWWEDRPAAMARLVGLLRAFADEESAEVTVVFDGARRPEVAAAGGSGVTILFAADEGAAEADDLIVDLAASTPSPLHVVTSDVALAERLPDAVEVVGGGGFRDRIERLREVE